MMSSPKEKRWRRFCGDKSIFGPGRVGFDINDFAWSQHTFGEQHAFVLEMIDCAASKHRWEALDYAPPCQVAGRATDVRGRKTASSFAPGRFDPDFVALSQWNRHRRDRPTADGYG